MDFNFDISNENFRLKWEERLENRKLKLKTERKLYADDDGLPILRRSCVMYLDELGTSARLSNYDNEMLRQDIDVYDRTRDILHSEATNDQDSQRSLYFSDNVVVVEPIGEDTFTGPNPTLLAQTICAAIYQLNLAITGRVLRGGIAIGNAYADGNFVTGPAHLSAVLLEETQAEVPRILLDSEAVKIAKEAITDDKPNESVFSDILLVDDDKKVFVNYLPLVFEDENIKGALSPISGLEKHRDHIISMLQAFKGTAVAGKYEWLASYHNFVILESRHHQMKNLYIAGYPTRNFRPLDGD